MKLFSKYNRLNLAVTISIFLIGSCVFYFLLRFIFITQVDDALENEREEIIAYTGKYHKLPEIINTSDEYTAYANTFSGSVPGFKNTFIQYDTTREWSRQMQFGINVTGTSYTVFVSKPLEENEDLLQVVVMITVAMIGLILLAGYLINRAVLTRLWQPFYNTIDYIKRFNIDEKVPVAPVVTNIDEFNLLNENMYEMISRVEKDFQSLKEFTGYAAHEMQTPLAVIRTRLDLIIQNEALLQNNAAQVADIENAVSKLSRLYKSLLLLTKIENNQFSHTDTIQLDELVQHKIDEVSELSYSKGVRIEFTKQETVTVLFHAYLADIIIGNLISNAVRYNKKNGWIGISLHAGLLSISNQSQLGEIKPENLFQRFYRDPNVKEDGNGLGLAIVKKICDAAGFMLTYFYKDGMHTFQIHF